MFSKILENSQENPCVGVSFLIKLHFIKKEGRKRCFSVNIAKYLRKPILKNICERLLLIPLDEIQRFLKSLQDQGEISRKEITTVCVFVPDRIGRKDNVPSSNA